MILKIVKFRYLGLMQDQELFKKIASNLKNARLEQGLTQEKFAEKIDKTWSYIAKIETGQNLTLKTINQLANDLGIPVSRILRID